MLLELLHTEERLDNLLGDEQLLEGAQGLVVARVEDGEERYLLWHVELENVLLGVDVDALHGQQTVRLRSQRVHHVHLLQNLLQLVRLYSVEMDDSRQVLLLVLTILRVRQLLCIVINIVLQEHSEDLSERTALVPLFKADGLTCQ